MKKKLVGLTTVVAVLGIVGMAQAELTVIGTANYNGQDYKLIWDDDNNGNSIVWLDYSNAAAVWDDHMAWAAGLDSSLTYNIYPSYTVNWIDHSWRLPNVVDGPDIYGYDGTTTRGYNITSSEFGHLFHVELNNLSYIDTSGNEGQLGWGLINTGDFDNLTAFRYYSGTRYSSQAPYVWIYDFSVDYLLYIYPNAPYLGIAVRNVAVTTEPPPDADNDGVEDALDSCPDTPPGSIVDCAGCPIALDTDNDGVVDAGDTCPDTPTGSYVDNTGCPAASCTPTGTPILITNPSFDDDILADGAWVYPITDWTTTGIAGLFNPHDSAFTSEAGDGLHINTAFSNGGIISQVLTETLQAGVTYTLSADVGRRNESTSTFYGYSLELWADGKNLGKLVGGSGSIEPDTFNKVSFSYTPSAEDPIGAAIEIRLTAPASQTNFDNIELTVQ